MIDIHCHILPGTDDGAGDREEALQMAALAAESGVHRIIATPHIYGSAAAIEDDTARAAAAFDRFEAALKEEGIPVSLYRGAEVLCLPETPALAARGLLPTLAQTAYLLTEFYFDEPFEEMDERLLALQEAGVNPIVAHPERYACIRRDPFLTARWFDRGIVLQLNKGSILGAFGPSVQQTAEQLLLSGLAHTVASDAHHADRRTPHMRAVCRRLAELCPPAYADVLLEDNPHRVLKGLPMVPA